MSATILTGRPEAIRIPGPMRARVVVEARNVTRRIGGEDEAQHAPLYGYTIDVPPGHVWELSAVMSPAVRDLLGSNGGVRVIVEPAPRADALAPPLLAQRDLPCDLAVTAIDAGACAVPRPCDPIPAGAMVALPADLPAMVTVPARGGMVRTRFFDGLFMTRAELETEQRRLRTAHALQNRAHGAGVVWGLIPSFDGKTIRVGLGYGVDCCGNDLLVTTRYAVAAGALAGDPAAALPPRGAVRRHLLLEYVEVPEAQRPVHDECGTVRTEPSRVRETVRLRLVPPRDFDGRGPIDDLLATGVLSGDVATPTIDIPFVLWVDYRNEAGGSQVRFDFHVELDGNEVRLNVPGVVGAVIESASKSGWTMLSAAVWQENQDDPTHPDRIGGLDPATGVVRWELGHPSAAITRFWIEWEARHVRARGRLIGRTPMSWAGDVDVPSNLRFRADASTVRFEADPPGPCDHECCTTGGTDQPRSEQRGRFPTEPPWIHPLPGTGAPADPRVLDLALAELGLRSAIDVNAATHDAVRALLASWCDSLLWRGPGCGGPPPHGVVIGCARVVNGAIVGVEAWGGRRWVVRPPLVDHVATQLGVTPPDQLVSRLAGLACCAADQPVTVATAPPLELRREPAPDVVRRLVDRRFAERTPPLSPLVRPFAARLAADLVRATPVDALAGVEAPLVERLRAVGVTSAGALLAADPEALLAGVGGGDAPTPVALARALAAAEELASTLARTVGDAVTGGARPIASRRDLADEAARHAIADALAARAHVPTDRVRAALTVALR